MGVGGRLRSGLEGSCFREREIQLAEIMDTETQMASGVVFLFSQFAFVCVFMLGGF